VKLAPQASVIFVQPSGGGPGWDRRTSILFALLPEVHYHFLPTV